MASALRTALKKVCHCLQYLFNSLFSQFLRHAFSIQSATPIARSSAARFASTAAKQPTLKERLAEIIPAAQEHVRTTAFSLHFSYL